MDSTANEQLEIDQAYLPRFKMIYLSKNMAAYTGAHYQQDVIEEMDRQHEVFFYGPGFPHYDPEDKIDDVISKAPFSKPDLICVGHSWLGDDATKGIHIHQDLNLQNTQIPKVMILNKEYVLLKEKLDFVRNNDVQVVFSHLHNIQDYAEESERTKFIFWPFAANHHTFYDRNLPKKYDLSFTGVLRNRYYSHTQEDFRIRVQKELFYCIDEFRIVKKWKYRNLDFYWRGVPTSSRARRLDQRIHSGKPLDVHAYAELLNQSSACLCSLSPLGLISPRYFESMASKCIVLCPMTSEHKYHFKDGFNCVMVNNDLSDFKEKLLFAIDVDSTSGIRENAFIDVMHNHTWSVRVNQFTKDISHLV
ncbi:MAG: glycosyltransferase family protein [Anaerolineaceae bacterium]|jgi:hypothetical protein